MRSCQTQVHDLLQGRPSLRRRHARIRHSVRGAGALRPITKHSRGSRCKGRSGRRSWSSTGWRRCGHRKRGKEEEIEHYGNCTVDLDKSDFKVWPGTVEAAVKVCLGEAAKAGCYRCCVMLSSRSWCRELSWSTSDGKAHYILVRHYEARGNSLDLLRFEPIHLVHRRAPPFLEQHVCWEQVADWLQLQVVASRYGR